MKSRLALLSAAALTAASLWIVATRIRIDPDVAGLLPDRGQGAALRQYVRAFGGGDLGLVLLRGSDPSKVRDASADATAALAACPHVKAALDRLPLHLAPDPSLVWAAADPPAIAELGRALEPEAMRKRLAETRAMLLGPGASAFASELSSDPLRLRQVALGEAGRLAAGASSRASGLMVSSGGEFAADDGKARLVLFAPEGQALRGADTHDLVQSVHRCLEPVRSRRPDVSIEVTGGHAIAAATEDMIRRDLQWSGAVSTLLASIAFALTFRRLRALLAVLPPLALGTLWSAAAGGMVFRQLSAISAAFVAVVVGVGVDTGVHVYAALLEARRSGLAPGAAATAAIRRTAQPTLLAAATAGAAFGSLALSSIPALQQFGVLCALGEVLTAVAILLVTPAIGAWLERGVPPAEPSRRWPGWLHRGASHAWAPLGLALTLALPLALLAARGLPRMGDAIVAVRPTAVAPIRTLDDVLERFGGGGGQWVVLESDTDLGKARQRADRLLDKLSLSMKGVGELDGLARFAPTVQTQRARLDERDRLGLPSRVPMLRAALVEEGFASDKFAPAFAWMSAPSHVVHDVLDDQTAASGLLRARFIGRDGPTWYVATYVRPVAGREAEVEALIHDVDPGAVVTGYARLDGALRSSLLSDFPRIGAVAAVLVLAAMATALRSRRDVGIAVATLSFEIVWVLAVIGWLGIRLHAYDVMVLPVLLGVTVDEAMFLMHRARDRGLGDSLQHEGPSVVATGTTTAAGFGALLVCRYDALADMGKVGLSGVLIGLAAALLVVPVLSANRGRRAASP